MAILNRFPSLQENIRVYAVIAALIYGWSILWLFWELPSWLYYLTIGEMLPVFAYALATNFLESLLILAAINLCCFLLPKRWLRESFVARSFLLVSLGLGYLMYFASLLGKEDDYPAGLLVWSPVVFVVFFLLSILLDRVASIRSLAENIADRLTVFLYLTIPLSAISLLLVIARNAW